MSRARRKFRHRNKPQGQAVGAETQGGKPQGAHPRGGRKPTHARRQRWFYDVRQYALLTDEDGKILILQLPAAYDEGAANSWTLPGGKLEPSDDPTDGVLREIREETGLTAALAGPCGIARWSSRNSKKLGIFYKGIVAGKAPVVQISSEHQRALWVKPEEIGDFPFHREDMRLVIRRIFGVVDGK